MPQSYNLCLRKFSTKINHAAEKLTTYTRISSHNRNHVFLCEIFDHPTDGQSVVGHGQNIIDQPTTFYVSRDQNGTAATEKKVYWVTWTKPSIPPLLWLLVTKKT